MGRDNFGPAKSSVPQLGDPVFVFCVMTNRARLMMGDRMGEGVSGVLIAKIEKRKSSVVRKYGRTVIMPITADVIQLDSVSSASNAKLFILHGIGPSRLYYVKSER